MNITLIDTYIYDYLLEVHVSTGRDTFLSVSTASCTAVARKISGAPLSTIGVQEKENSVQQGTHFVRHTSDEFISVESSFFELGKTAEMRRNGTNKVVLVDEE